jgi:hypothetical protein
MALADSAVPGKFATDRTPFHRATSVVDFALAATTDGTRRKVLVAVLALRGFRPPVTTTDARNEIEVFWHEAAALIQKKAVLAVVLASGAAAVGAVSEPVGPLG